MSITDATGPAVSWYVPAGERLAHAFPDDAPGFMRSLCQRRARWTVDARPRADHDPHCIGCIDFLADERNRVARAGSDGGAS